MKHHPIKRALDAMLIPSRPSPITAICGLNGACKTLMGVHWAIEDANQGRNILSNVEINHPRAAVLKSIDQLDAARDCTLLLDEVTAWMPGRGWQNVPREVLAVIAQFRKRNIEVIWTSPSPKDADPQLRRVTQTMYVNYPFLRMGWKAPLICLSTKWEQDIQYKTSIWLPRTAKSWGAYDPKAIVTPAGAAGYCPDCGLPIKPSKATCQCEHTPQPIHWNNFNPIEGQ